MSDVNDHKITERLEVMEKTVRNMRIAIIMIAAFFIYQALAPSGLWKGIEVKETVKMKELVIIDEHGHEWAKLGAGSDGGIFMLNNEAGDRLQLLPNAIHILEPSGDRHIERLQINNNQLLLYDNQGELIDAFPQS